MADPRSTAGHWRPKNYFSHRVESVRAFDSLNEGGGIAVAFQALRGDRPDFYLEGGQSLSLSLWLTRSASGFVTVPTVEADVLTIRFIMSGVMTRRYRRRDDVIGTGIATISAFEELRNAEASPKFSSVSATITRATLLERHRVLEASPEAQLPQFEPITAIDTVPMQALFQSVSRMQDRLRLVDLDQDLVFPLLEEIIAYQLLSGWPRRHNQLGDRSAHASACRLGNAVNYIEAHLSEPIRLADVAAAMGVSVRVLQLSFKRELGTTPFGFILARRLERVREELRREANGDLTISQLAQRWGFVHMSDFALRYRKAFGCTPSDDRRS